MKKLLLVLAVILFANVARAQFSIGAKVGYQSAKLNFEKAEIKKGLKEHLTFGAFARLNIGRIIIQPELLWFKSGNVLNFDIDPSVEFDTELTIDMHPSVTLTQQNMAFPIFIGTKISFLRLYAGPVMYFVLSQKQEVEANGQKKSVNFDNLDAQGMTWGAALNVGVDIWRLTFDINYSFGLSSVFKTDQINWSFGEQSGSFKLDKTKQNVFTITVGLKIL